MTKTKIVLASMLAVAFATSAFASDNSMGLRERNAYWKTTKVSSGTKTYAYAPLSERLALPFTKAEQREFDRVPFSEISSR